MDETEQLGDAGSGANILIRRVRLVVTSGTDAGAMCVNNGSRIRIGSHSACDLVLDDRAISRFHCELSLQGGALVLRDLESSNGTYVNGVRIRECYVEPSSMVQLGRSTLRVDDVEGHVRVPLSESRSFGRLVGDSDVMRAVFAVLERAAQSDATLLIQGETGTGKGAAAEAVHEASARAQGPLVVVDCGALPANLLDSELFGHTVGAFTGAATKRVGALSAASGGTLFLDEIGELPVELQPKLLRCLEERQVKALGSESYNSIDVRVIAATNRDLRTEVNAQRFRSDLFYRLAVLEVSLPPLRERREDLAQLVPVLATNIARADHEAWSDPSFLRRLAAHSWPGNVRELRNYLERCTALDHAPPIVTAAAAPPPSEKEPEVAATRPLRQVREDHLARVERAYCVDLLRRHGDNVSAAARAAGMHRVHLYRILRRYHLR